jgi:glycosyltransferase involved in cell wall biosynthesis
MRILWHSNAPWAATGYGQQTGLFAPRVAERHEVAVSSFYGLEGAPLNWNGLMVFPGLGGTYGNESIPLHARRFFGGDERGGLLFTLMDVWVLNPDLVAGFDTVCWVPVDHDPCPPAVGSFFARSGAVPFAMSRFGERQLAQFDPIYVPHGVDTAVYRPGDRDAARAHLGIDDDGLFVVGMVAANKGNPSRKSFVATLEAFAAFHERHPRSRLYLHADMDGTWTQGVPLAPVIKAVGLDEEAVRVADPYAMHFHPFSPDTMASMFRAFDVLVNCATGEGFGIPVLEAQACGTPVIVTDFSAMPEVGAAGWRVGGRRWWTPQQSWQMQPDVPSMVAALEDCYRLSDRARGELSARAVEHAAGFDAGLVAERYLLPGLDEAAERLAERRPSPLSVAA